MKARRLKIRSGLLVTAIVVSAWAASHADSRGSVATPTVNQVGLAKQLRAPAVVPTNSAPKADPAKTRQQPSPCAHNRRAQLIVVSINRQHEWACAGQRTVLSTPVTTGATSRPGEATPRGTFAVQGLNRNTTLHTSAAGAFPVKFWIPFHLGVWGFHDASWQTMPFGSKSYATRGSHGCVHMPLAAIRWLFHWVHYGTRVRIT